MPSQGVVYQVVRDHFETFRAQAAGLRGGEGLPRFVEEEFLAFLRCGFLALRPFENLRVAASLVERRRCSGPS